MSISEALAQLEVRHASRLREAAQLKSSVAYRSQSAYADCFISFYIIKESYKYV